MRVGVEGEEEYVDRVAMCGTMFGAATMFKVWTAVYLLSYCLQVLEFIWAHHNPKEKYIHATIVRGDNIVQNQNTGCSAYASGCW